MPKNAWRVNQRKRQGSMSPARSPQTTPGPYSKNCRRSEIEYMMGLRGAIIFSILMSLCIAVFADAHYNIQKNIYGNRTLSTLKTLQCESQIRELAAMLAGLQYTEASINSVRELMQKTELWKETCLNKLKNSPR